MQWLKVTTSNTINHDALDLLPEDGNVSRLTLVTIETINDHSTEDVHVDEDSYDAHLAGTFVPITGCQLTQQEIISQSVLEQQSDHLPSVPPTVIWPAAGTNPNSILKDTYFSNTFSNWCCRPVSSKKSHGNYFKHLMMFQDGRFTKHPRL